MWSACHIVASRFSIDEPCASALTLITQRRRQSDKVRPAARAAHHGKTRRRTCGGRDAGQGRPLVRSLEGVCARKKRRRLQSTFSSLVYDETPRSLRRRSVGGESLLAPQALKNEPASDKPDYLLTPQRTILSAARGVLWKLERIFMGILLCSCGSPDEGMCVPPTRNIAGALCLEFNR
jgi:hypothetical protein